MDLFGGMTHWTVTKLTQYLRHLLEDDPDLQDLWVEGEISNLARPASGHVYFTLKDSNAALKCVMWKSNAARLDFMLEEGKAVEAHGSLGIYEASGQYQLYAVTLRPLGEGALYKEFLRLKALLEAEGLFDPARKRSIPELPKRIGIVTSATGAALQDMLNVLRRRMPLANVILAPTPVQGVEAPPAIAAALVALNQVAAPDVILLARGGGSIEDLWAFNDERVVRAVVASPAPIVTGVGHETDFTLADFAADLRAPTPTAAAELVSGITLSDLQQTLASLNQVQVGYMGQIFEQERNRLAGLRSTLGFYSPLNKVQTERQRVDELERRSAMLLQHRMELAGANLMGWEARLAALNPLSVLERGFALVMKDGQVVASKTQAKPGDQVQIRLRDGELDARVMDKG